ncbi:hypothetical protein ACFV4N_34405, partial [Actinosynnema sp. NPDC059797]
MTAIAHARGTTGAVAATETRTRAGVLALAVLRVATGLVFLWAFLDKAFGFGYATKAANAWVDGGSPTRGFLG